MRNPLRHRDPELVRALLDAVYLDNVDDKPEPIPWGHLVDAFTSASHDHKTVANVIGELVQIGALHRLGHYTSPTRDTRAVVPTLLGRAWLAGEPLPPIPERTTT